MDASKSRTCTVRLTPATWARVQSLATQLDIPPTRVLELAARAIVGEPVQEHYKAVADALSGMRATG